MKNVADAYPLTPMQQGMLFHSLLAETPGMYLEQIRATLEGELSISRLHEAWQMVVDRHTVLRSAMVWDGLDKPLQVVRRNVTLPWSEHDLGHLDEQAYQARLATILTADRAQGFELSRAPLMRCTAVLRPDGACDLIWTYHHMILDGWCSSIIVNEVLRIYAALELGEKPRLDAPRPYKEYISWLSSQDRSRAERFWRGELEGVASPTDLRLEQHSGSDADSPDQSFEYSEHLVTLEAGLASAARSFSRAHRITLSTLIQGAWAIVLNRYSGDSDVVLGATVSGRPPHLAGIETMLGLFVNTLPVRIKLDPDEQLRPWLEHLQARQVEREEHGTTPLVDIQSWIGLAPGARLFESVVAFESYPVDHGGARATRGLRISDSRVSMEETNYPLVLQVVPEPELVLRALYDARRYPRETVVRLGHHLTRVIESMISDPGQRLGRVSLLTPAELGQLSTEWASVVEAPSATCLHEMLEETVRRRGRAAAVTFGSEHLSYDQLNRRANRLARHLRSLGIGPDVLVGLYLERSPELIVGLLAILKAGGAYVPLDPTHPQRRNALVLEDCQARVLLTSSSLRGELPPTTATIALVDPDEHDLARHSDENLGVAVGPDNLAYVLYTSGSTGRPKGSLISHRNVARLFSSTRPRFRFDEHDVWTLFHTIAFDFSVWEIWGALLNGGRVVVVPHWICRSPDELLDLLVSEKVTVLNQTPSAFRQLIDIEKARDPRPQLALRLVIFGGERLELSTLAPWFERHGDEQPTLVNMYGITETTVHVTWRFLRGSDVGGSASLIGEPIPDLRVVILDGNLQPVPAGVAGELCIAGPGLSRGYLNQDELTRQRFIDSPFESPAGERLFRSGDLARRLANGDIEYLGRIDHQVKIRGFRIELGEIESVINEHPGVSESVVVARSSIINRSGSTGVESERQHQTTLHAYAVAASGPDAAGSEPDHDPSDRSLSDDVVCQWERVFEEQYRGGASDRDPGFDITGWNSSYSGQPIEAEQMHEWVGQTVTRMLDLAPRRALEIGCGTGLLLGRIAGHCQHYVGTDLSQEALARVESLVAVRPELAHVRLLHQPADVFEGLATEGFDTVLLSSIVQYFPDVDYLIEVIGGALDCLEPDGVLLLCDLRSNQLLPAHHASVELHRAEASTTLGQLRQRIDQRVAQEEELAVDPELFTALGSRLESIAGVGAQLRRGRFDNEMTRFRYDVLIRKADGRPDDRTKETIWHEWDERSWSLDRVRTELETGRPACLGLRSIPNARLVVETELLRLLDEPRNAGVEIGAFRADMAGRAPAAVHPEDIWELGEQLSYQVELTWSAGQSGCFDAVLVAGSPTGKAERADRGWWARPCSGSASRSPSLPWQAYANDPMRRLRSRRLGDELKDHLKQRLPSYMVPPHIMVLDVLPLTPNGKVDTKALPQPEADLSKGDGNGRPINAVEEILAGVWADVLGATSVGRHDDFFELGGHSLMATQVLSRVRSAFSIDIPMRQLFSEPTVAGFSRAVEACRRGPGSSDSVEPDEPILKAVEHTDRLPLSFSQQRLWFLHQLEDGAAATYNVPLALELRGRLSLEALRHSLDRIVARHASLRTVFVSDRGEPFQQVCPPAAVPIDVVGLAHVPPARRAAEARRLAREHATQPFDLERDAMLRASVYRVDEEEHLLLLCMHHICSDGWSTGILLEELGQLYRAYSRGVEPETLDELAIQYADYAVWQRRWLQGDRLEHLLGYWRSRLGPDSSRQLLRLPTDRPRPPVLSFRGQSVQFRLDQELSGRLRGLARRCGSTLYMILLAGFGALLHRYCGNQRIVIGSPVANRRRTEAERLIGFFVNTLVLDLDCAGNPSFRKLLERVRQATLGAYDHQDMPFEMLVEDLQPERDLSHTPLFQVMLVLQNTRFDPPRLPGLSARGVTLDLGASKLDLTLGLEEDEDGLAGELQYNTDLFDSATVRRIISHYRSLLTGAVARPASKLWQLPLLDQAEKAQLAVWGGSSSARSETLPWHLAFDRRVAECPERPAVVTRQQALSYAQLDQLSAALAERLDRAGAGPEVIVPICLDRGPRWVVALLAVARAGGAFVVLDPSFPDDRLSYTVSDTRAPIVITQKAHQSRLGSTGAHLILVGPEEALEDIDPRSSRQRHAWTDRGATEEQAAYAVYTSGTTGRPKGVLVSHANLANLVKSQVERFDIRPGDRILQLVAPTFDVAVADIGMALASGAALCLAATEDLLPGPGLISLVRELEITHLASPPSALAAVAPQDLPALRVVMVGGEPSSPEVIERWSTGRRLFNCYGPTEATVCATAAEHDGHTRTMSIGGPLDNVVVRILDSHGQAVPIGVAGELHIGGHGVTRGYLGLPGLTAERFVPDPFDQDGGARLYRSGDLARYLGDGRIELLGREDRQLKIRGYRVEPEEIETALRDHASVAQAAVVVERTSSGSTQLVACVEPEPPRPFDTEQLREHLRQRLPHFMMPSRLLMLAALPLADTGKIDYKVLSSQIANMVEPPRTPSRSMTSDEQQMAEIWQEVLERPGVGLDDSFFEIGGHSLAAMRVISRVNETFGLEIPVRSLFEAPTLTAFARAIASSRRLDPARDHDEAPPLQRLPRRPMSRLAGVTSDSKQRGSR